MIKKTLFACGLLVFGSTAALAAFADVENSDTNAQAILWLQAEGYVQGFADGSYRPDQQITRAEFTKILLLSTFSKTEVEKCAEAVFKDSEAGAWYLPYLCFAADKGIIKGYADQTFQPQRNINYAEAAKIVVNTVVGVQKEGEGEEWWKPFAETLEEKDAVPASVKDGAHLLTRGEMASIIYELNGAPDFTPVGTPQATLPPPTTAPPVPGSPEASINIFESNTQKVSFAYAKGIADDSSDTTYPTSVLEDGSRLIVAAPLPEADFDACVEKGLCREANGQKLVFVDALIVLTKTAADADLNAAVAAKAGQIGTAPEACQLVTLDEAPAGWTKLRVEPNTYISFSVDAEGKYTDAEGKAITLAEANRLKDREATEKCGLYAGGYGKSFFLYNEAESANRFLYVPYYGQDRLIDHTSIRFE